MKVSFITLGCKVNYYETKKMMENFKEEGFQITEKSELKFAELKFAETKFAETKFGVETDIFVINTCTVTNMADRKSRQAIHRAKKMNPNCLVIAVGCYVDSDKNELKKDKSIDIILGNKEKEKIVKIVKKHLEQNGQKICENPMGFTDLKESEPIMKSERTRAFVKVQDGCNQYCSYCIIPYVRGRSRSREIADVVEEVTKLAQHGFKEVVITGIHLSSHHSLLELLEEVAKINGMERIRLGSLEPRIITEHFLGELIKIKKICPHFHLSLQSGCDATLKRMNRHYTVKEYKEKCELLRKYFEYPAITTDVIVGFPGETEEEFMKTVRFLSEIALADIHVFKYSVRTGTKAEKMPDQVMEQIKAERSNQLLFLVKKWRDEYAKKFIGKTEKILLEEKVIINNTEYFIGYNERYVKVMVDIDSENKKIYKENEIFDILVEKIAKK